MGTFCVFVTSLRLQSLSDLLSTNPMANAKEAAKEAAMVEVQLKRGALGEAQHVALLQMKGA